jgi:hypothetical protein
MDWLKNLKPAIKQIIVASTLLLLLADLSYSYYQHYNRPLDGDMQESLVPDPSYHELFKDPFGIEVVKNQKGYANPNRYFGHKIFYEYYNNTVQYIQRFTDPIKSLFHTSAIAKIAMQIGLLFLLSLLVSGVRNIASWRFLIALALLFPLFQTNGFYKQIGLIDYSITYSFFYGFPTIFLLAFLLPLFYKKLHNIRLGLPIKILMFVAGIVSCFSGPLNTGVILIVVLYYFLAQYLKGGSIKSIKTPIVSFKKVDSDFWTYLMPMGFIALYSLYLGTFNTNNNLFHEDTLTLYSRLPKGLAIMYGKPIGVWLLWGLMALNLFLISKKFPSEKGARIVAFAKWSGLFILLYVLLLPLGGYRPYRPNVLRYDSMTPVSISFFLVYGISTIYLLENFTVKLRKRYLLLLGVFTFIFTIKDNPVHLSNEGEQAAMQEIQNSEMDTVKLQTKARVISWSPIYKPESSLKSSKLMKRWNVTNREKLFYYPKPQDKKK